MANAILNVGQTGGQVNISTAAAPATPAAGIVTLYAGNDKALHALNSDGLDITIAAAGPASPITEERINSLVSTGVGATAGVGANCAVVIGNNACTVANVGYASVVIGDGAKHCEYGGESVIIGQLACATNLGVVSIGQVSIGRAQRGINIGYGSTTCCNNALGSMALGYNAISRGNGNLPGIAIGCSALTHSDGITLGNGVSACGSKSLVIGSAACAFKASEIAIGNTIATPATSALCSVYVGNCITPGGAAQAGVLGQVLVGFKVSQNQANENVGGSVLVGHCITNNHQPGVGSDGDTIVGICSTTACSRGNNAIFGRNHTAGGSSNTIVGYNNSYTATDSLSHYYNVLLGVSNTLGASTIGSVVIGTSSNATNACTIAIGYSACASVACAIAIGGLAKGQGTWAIAIGNNSCVTSNVGSIAIGLNSIAQGGNATTVIGYAACGSDAATAYGGGAKANALAAVALGYDSNAPSGYAIAIGASSTANASYGIALGSGAGASHSGAVAIGQNVTTTRTNTTHVNSLVAYGQAASLTHTIGSTGGTVTVDFNNGNVQTLSLTSSISTLTKSNPITGGVYTFEITQAGSGSYTIAWGADVKWPGGTPPTLSTAVGAVDYVTLVYTGTNYYGNANLNFS